MAKPKSSPHLNVGDLVVATLSYHWSSVSEGQCGVVIGTHTIRQRHGGGPSWADVLWPDGKVVSWETTKLKRL